MRIVCTHVNRLETPNEVRQYLNDYGGMNLFGEPNFRIVWSNSRSTRRTKRFVDADTNGEILRERVETRDVLKYSGSRHRDRFIVEAWHPPSFYGSPEDWQRANTMWQDGHVVQPIGDYPSRGDYEYVDTVEWVDEYGTSHFAWPTRLYAKYIVDTVRYLKSLSYDQIAGQLTSADEKREVDMENYYLERVRDASRPFGGIQPFVSLAGLSLPS